MLFLKKEEVQLFWTLKDDMWEIKTQLNNIERLVNENNSRVLGESNGDKQHNILERNGEKKSTLWA